MFLPRWFRDLKIRERPPWWVRVLLRMVEECGHPLHRSRLDRYIEEIEGSSEWSELSRKVDLAIDGLGGMISPLQRRAEIIEFLERIRAEQPLRLLEVGTLRGGMLYLFAQVAPSGAKILSIDVSYRGPGMGYERWKVPLFEAFGWPDRDVHLIRGDSHADSTLAAVRQVLDGELLDVLFIDGDHSDEGVAQDFQDYGALVREGGLICMDGIEPRRGESCGTDRFWGVLKTEYDGEEFVEARDHGYGIGVVRKALPGV